MDQLSARERLRQTFDAVADDYQEARPEYPSALYDALLALTGARPQADALCEVGSASGKATLPLARQGFEITCVELGAALAAEARRNLAGFERVTVLNANFETWQPAGGERFGLVFAATAWHWIDPAVKYRKAASLLRPGGHLAFWEAVHVIPGDGDPFFRGIQDVYDEIGEGMPGDCPGVHDSKPACSTRTRSNPARFRRASAASAPPSSTQLIANPRRASGSVAFPEAHPTSHSSSTLAVTPVSEMSAS